MGHPAKSIWRLANNAFDSVALCTVLALFPVLSWACSVLPETLFESNRRLVESADAIVLARVIGLEPAIRFPTAKRRMAIFHFALTETLKGKAAATFDLQGYSTEEKKDNPGDFNGHGMPEFWAEVRTNSVMPGDCEAYGIFQTGGTYLLFLRKEPHIRGFENVTSEQDLWLKVVRVLVKPAGGQR